MSVACKTKANDSLAVIIKCSHYDVTNYHKFSIIQEYNLAISMSVISGAVIESILAPVLKIVLRVYLFI